MAITRSSLPLALFLGGCQLAMLHQRAPAAPPVATTVPPAVAPHLQSAPPLVQQQPPPVMPAFPPQSTVVPLPSHAPGSIFGPPAAAQPAAPAAATPSPVPANVAPDGTVSPQFGLPAGPQVTPGLPNPIAVPVVDDQFAWEQIADVVSDYFTIAAEQRARRGELFMEGRIETAPLTGASWLEPHRRDSVGAFNRWESTFQTIRRRALVRVMPDATGYHVEMIVEKELENMPRPQQATAGTATFRTDTSLPTRRTDPAGELVRDPPAHRWIPLGRDPALEQRMLADIHARLSGATVSGSVFAR